MTMNITKEVRNMFSEMKGRATVLIDGSNFYHTGLSLGVKLDFKRLRDFLNSVVAVSRIHYFATRPYIDSSEKDRLRPLLDWLAYNGYDVHEHRSFMRQNPNGQTNRFLRTNSMTVDLCLTAVRAFNSNVDNIILFTGDGDYTELVEHLKTEGARVCVISSTKPTRFSTNSGLNNPSIVSDPLRRAADIFIEISDIIDLFAMPLENRNMPPSELDNNEKDDEESDGDNEVDDVEIDEDDNEEVVEDDDVEIDEDDNEEVVEDDEEVVEDDEKVKTAIG